MHGGCSIERNRFSARECIQGQISAPIVYSDVPLSFWGGIDPETGIVIDHHHPLNGVCVAKHILAIPGGRGSCTGSAVMLELLLNGLAPAGLILCEIDEILIVGVLVARLFFGKSIPVVVLDSQEFNRLKTFETAFLNVEPDDACTERDRSAFVSAKTQTLQTNAQQLYLSQEDHAVLEGTKGEGRRLALELIIHMAKLQNATRLLDVTQAHIDACIYTGPAVLKFARLLRKHGAKTQVPTTLNAISVDICHSKSWQIRGNPAAELAQCYVDLGAKPSFTCAPYLLDTAPRMGDNIGWAESNAVMYANSILGARTQKYPDFVDACISVTGRAPESGCHVTQSRSPQIRINIVVPDEIDDLFYPLVGYSVGKISGRKIPILCGLEALSPDNDDLKALSAAFATTSSAPMLHIRGITPEWKMFDNHTMSEEAIIDIALLEEDFRELNAPPNAKVDLIALGNPHFSLSECHKLARCCAGKVKSPDIEMVVTLGRSVLEQFRDTDDYEVLREFGVTFVNDTCWCMISQPVIHEGIKTIMTNSGKYAHYGQGLTGCAMIFGSLVQCVDAAVSGIRPDRQPLWLEERSTRMDRG